MLPGGRVFPVYCFLEGGGRVFPCPVMFKGRAGGAPFQSLKGGRVLPFYHLKGGRVSPLSKSKGRAWEAVRGGFTPPAPRPSLSTRILGRRTAPFSPFLIPNCAPHGATPRS